jgi:hypothetical protein
LAKEDEAVKIGHDKVMFIQTCFQMFSPTTQIQALPVLIWLAVSRLDATNSVCQLSRWGGARECPYKNMTGTLKHWTLTAVGTY